LITSIFDLESVAAEVLPAFPFSLTTRFAKKNGLTIGRATETHPDAD